MAFTRPTLSQIVDRIKGDFKSGLSLQAILKRSFLDVMAKAFGGASHTIHGNIQNAIDKKFFPNDGDESTVIRWGTLYNTPRKDATLAELVIDVVGTTGGTLAASTPYVRSDGTVYLVKAEVTVPASTTVQATIVCEDEGDIGNMDPGDTVSLQSAITGIDSEGTVVTTTISGEDLEDLELYRERVLERMAQPPSGGKVSDYISFGKTVAGVTRVWVLPNHLGQGTVGLTFVEDDEVPIIPDAPKVAEVQLAVEELKPITADLFVFAPTETQINPTIQLKPNTAAVRAAVQAELEDLLFRDGEVAGASDPTQVGLAVVYTGKISLSKINEAISIASGEEDHVLVSPTTDVQPPTGGLATLGTITFQTLP